MLLFLVVVVVSVLFILGVGSMLSLMMLLESVGMLCLKVLCRCIGIFLVICSVFLMVVKFILL